MLDSIEFNFEKVEEILKRRKKQSIFLDEIDETLVTDIKNLLAHFKTASEQLSSDEEATLHLVLAWIENPKGYCEIK